MIKEIVRNKMVAAMKAKDEKQKTVYKYLLDQLMKAEKAKQDEDTPNPVLMESEEVAVIQSLIKQTKGGIEKTMAEANKKGIDTADLATFIEEREFELKLYSEFVPAEMTAEEIQKVIEDVAADLPIPINKGMLMKNLMPKIKNMGNADGKLVSTLVEEFLKR